MFVVAGCPTVHRYGPDEGEPRAGSVRVTPRETPRETGRRPRPVASLPGHQLGDGTLRGELLAGARRVVGWRFGRDGVAEVDAFRLHLQAVAVWDGDTVAVADPMPGDIWRGSGGSFGIVEEVSGGGRFGVITVAGEGAVARREVVGGRFERGVGVASGRR